jgi:hypothetical protein
MAHFAELDQNNIVVRVIVVNNVVLLDEQGVEREIIGVAFCQSLFGANTRWVQTSYNGNFRVRYAGIGYTYDAVRDAFIPPQPYPSWVIDEATVNWSAPVPYPNDGLDYYWDEAQGTWVLIEGET